MAKRIVPPKSQDMSIQSPRERSEAKGEGVEFSFVGLIGIDSSKGLAIIGDNQKLYCRLMSMFCETQRHFVEEFHAAQRSEDPKAAIRAAHTLKGSAGTLGATAIQDAAQHLEALCQQHGIDDDLEVALQRVTAELDPVIAGLDLFLVDYAKSSGEGSDNNSVIAQVKLDLEHISDRDELLIILKQEILPLAKEISNLLVIGNVRQLSDKLALLGRKHQVKALTLSSEILRDAAECFDIAAINQHISELEDVISLISKDRGEGCNGQRKTDDSYRR